MLSMNRKKKLIAIGIVIIVITSGLLVYRYMLPFSTTFHSHYGYPPSYKSILDREGNIYILYMHEGGGMTIGKFTLTGRMLWINTIEEYINILVQKINRTYQDFSPLSIAPGSDFTSFTIDKRNILHIGFANFYFQIDANGSFRVGEVFYSLMNYTFVSVQAAPDDTIHLNYLLNNSTLIYEIRDVNNTISDKIFFNNTSYCFGGSGHIVFPESYKNNKTIYLIYPQELTCKNTTKTVVIYKDLYFHLLPLWELNIWGGGKSFVYVLLYKEDIVLYNYGTLQMINYSPTGMERREIIKSDDLPPMVGLIEKRFYRRGLRSEEIYRHNNEEVLTGEFGYDNISYFFRIYSVKLDTLNYTFNDLYVSNKVQYYTGGFVRFYNVSDTLYITYPQGRNEILPNGEVVFIDYLIFMKINFLEKRLEKTGEYKYTNIIY